MSNVVILPACVEHDLKYANDLTTHTARRRATLRTADRDRMFTIEAACDADWQAAHGQSSALSRVNLMITPEGAVYER
ncbi:hypothetical protein ACFSYH_05950 [Populibacterium corticicola]|uniref:Uncharacterized protein n=1 Tax=Populibacterium corticicola TaxID=1812826 RepID=A0ABW5XCC9_9MICO